MPKQQDSLLAVLNDMGFRSTTKPPRARLETLPPDARVDVVDLYRKLGGMHPNPQLTAGSWDSCFDGGLVIEQHESQHFNRYPAASLKCEWASALPWRRAYMDYSTRFGGDCIKSRARGGYWSNDSSVRMFGPPGPQRELDGAGSPRWKQRALYDAMRDVAALNGAARLVRLAVYDVVGGETLGRVHDRVKLLDRNALHSLIISRTLSG